tara:strand:+ start:2278 stop:3492 length:1215 start_codon:yes stop_codon:yes gene_type:complete
MKEVLLKEYKNLTISPILSKEEKDMVSTHFLRGAFCEVKGRKDKKFKLEFIDNATGKTHYSPEISNNMWSKCSISYFKDWLVKVTDLSTGKVIHEHNLDLKDKRVYIHLDSKAIGDTLAWFPQLERFQEKHKCKIITSTFHNEWFESEYPNFEFVKPGTQVNNLYAQYSIGWFYNEDNKVNYNNIPIDFKMYPLAQTASEILGLDYKEAKPRLAFGKRSPSIQDKYVCIAPHASAHAKYWNYPGGWQTIIDYLKEKGYKVVMITREPLGDNWHDSKLGGTLKGVIDKTGNYSIADRVNDIKYADFFIGLGSGLSWLSWAVDTPTILISGFSKPYSEFVDCERVFPMNEDICNGCFNRTRLDAGDWEWCPDHKDTERMFECTKSITPSQVINSIENIIKNNNKKK